MSQASALIKRGQASHAQQFPAGTVTINGQAYTDFATGGLKKERDLINGGWLPERRVTFWAPVRAFTTAGQPLPKAHASELEWNGEKFAVDAVTTDATQTTCTIACIGPDK